ncbi:uncharacterized protein LOC126762734 [Bactrocera neohumeralis]|uniref:uncharacterized protein LOC120778561 n=1 Tax=Bactrocera tryoni TaxID=59916 RepID=UPI001A998F65|nr:uncharacterized protein LOC120778561 [Bactrocera tryoni]XP_050335659.1 uncharacterized protein LOC126762734 [Bactrocera neohumeralis]
MGRCRGVPFEFPTILLRLLSSPRRAGGRTNKMKSTNNYTNYNPNQQVLTQLIGQLMRGGNSSNGYRSRSGGGGSRQRGSVRRTATRIRRRPGIRTHASASTRRPLSTKPSSSGTSTKKPSSTSATQKRSATESKAEPDKKKTTSDDKTKSGDTKESKAKANDPLLKGLCESGVRWYMRYIKEGLEPKVACKKAWEHRTEPVEYEPQWGKEFQAREVEDEPRYRQRIRRRVAKSVEINEDYRIAVHPKDFPDQMLDLDSVIALEEAIAAEIAKGANGKLQFSNAHMRPGALLCDCVNEETVNWLKDIVTKLSEWEGPELTTSQERVIPDAYVMTAALSKSIEQDFQRTLALIAAQNEDLNTEVWKLVNERSEDGKNVVTIRVDKDSFNTMKRHEWKLYYRFEKVNVHFHRYLRYSKKPTLWITNPSCHKQNQVKPPGPSNAV